MWLNPTNLCAQCKAKDEFETHLEKDGLRGRIVEIETKDKVKDSQIIEKVRKRFIH